MPAPSTGSPGWDDGASAAEDKGFIGEILGPPERPVKEACQLRGRGGRVQLIWTNEVGLTDSDDAP
jgi:hypothetical protein